MKKQPYYIAENGDEYTEADFLLAAKGNKAYAEILKDRVMWQSPFTLAIEDLNEGEIIEFKGKYYMTGGEKDIVAVDGKKYFNAIHKLYIKGKVKKIPADIKAIFKADGEFFTAKMEEKNMLFRGFESFSEGLEYLREEEEVEDLFEHYGKIPQELSDILDKYELEDRLDYEVIKLFHAQVGEIGYTFEWGLAGVPYNLRKIPNWENPKKIFEFEVFESYSKTVFIEAENEDIAKELITEVNVDMEDRDYVGDSTDNVFMGEVTNEDLIGKPNCGFGETFKEARENALNNHKVITLEEVYRQWLREWEGGIGTYAEFLKDFSDFANQRENANGSKDDLLEGFMNCLK